MAPPRSRAPAGTGSGRRPRPRRASNQQPINARMVRGTWLLVALPLLLAAFTVGRPEPLPRPALPPTFDGESAAALAHDLADDYPDRFPGSPGALGGAQWFRDQLRLYGIATRTDTFTATIPGRGEVQLHNVVAVVQGDSPQRDRRHGAPRQRRQRAWRRRTTRPERPRSSSSRAPTPPLTGPGGLRARPAHRLVFVSTDGGEFGALGCDAVRRRARRLATDAVAIVSLDAIGGRTAPRLELAADRPRSPASELVRTAATRILEETGEEPRHASWLQQLLDLGFPFTLGEQGAFVARGTPAVTITTAGERPRPLFRDTRVDEERLGRLGRAAEGLIGSLDGGLELDETTTSYVYLGPPHRQRLGDPARPHRRSAALPLRSRRSLRAVPAAPDRARRRDPEPALAAALLGLRRGARARRRALRSVPGLGARPTRTADGRGRRHTVEPRRGHRSRPAAGGLARRPGAPDPAPAGHDRGEARRLLRRPARARPAGPARRRDEHLCADLPAAVALRLALAAAGPCGARRGARRAPRRRLRRPADPRRLVREALRPRRGRPVVPALARRLRLRPAPGGAAGVRLGRDCGAARRSRGRAIRRVS